MENISSAERTGSGRPGPLIAQLLTEIQKHGCKACGSVPVTFTPDQGYNNDPSNGILTINYVGNRGDQCQSDDGICENARPPSKFEWGVIGDSWTSGVAYSTDTQYDGNAGGCSRTNEAWPAQMAQDTSWTNLEQEFSFQGCAGKKFEDMKGQMSNTGSPRVVLGTMGGNNALFGQIVDDCILHANPLKKYGNRYDHDTDGTGECKKSLQAAGNYINGQLAADLRHTFDDIFSTDQAKSHPDFRLYPTLYVKFFNPDWDYCDKFSFSPWWVSKKPALVKDMRKAINDGVDLFNNVLMDTVVNYAPPAGQQVRYIEMDSAFANHRFCEPNYSFKDQWYSPDMWIWNLQYYDTQNPSLQPEGTPKTNEESITYMSHVSGDTIRNYQNLPDDPIFGSSSSGGSSGDGYPPWIARTFHPKKQGYEKMKEYFVQKLRDDKVPYVK
ncbi:MAG: hypothetical protein Q9227_007551 [Pyrenula ochraceoflavens]